MVRSAAARLAAGAPASRGPLRRWVCAPRLHHVAYPVLRVRKCDDVTDLDRERKVSDA